MDKDDLKEKVGYKPDDSLKKNKKAHAEKGVPFLGLLAYGK